MTPPPFAVHLAATITPGLDDDQHAHRLGQDIAAEATRTGGIPCMCILTGHGGAQPQHVEWTFSYRPDADDQRLAGFGAVTESAARNVVDQQLGARLVAEELQVMSQARVDGKFAELSKPLDMYGVEEFCELLGVSRPRLYQLRADDPDFPQPVRRGIWLGHMARDYAAKRR